MKVLIVCSSTSNYISNNFKLEHSFVYEQIISLNNIGVETETLLIKRKGIIGYLSHLLPLIKKLRNGDYDLIHAHYGFVGLLCNLQRKVPVVTTFHGSDIHRFKHKMFSIYAHLLSKKCIFVSNRIYSRIKPKLSKKVHIIPCGIDLNIFTPMSMEKAKISLKLDLNKHYVLFSSYFNNQIKNYPLAKEAMSSIDNVELIEMKGYSREEVNLLMNSSDVLLMTSFAEGSPMIIKEALACNCPVISTDVGDVKELISDLEGCSLVSFDANEIKSKILQIINIKCRLNSRERVTHLSLENTAKKIKKIYEEEIIDR